MKYKLAFKGDKWKFFWVTVGFGLLIAVTFSIAAIFTPLYMVWTFNFFVENTEVYAIKT